MIEKEIYDRYIDELVAYFNCEPADETIMRRLEEVIGIPEMVADDFRRAITSFIGIHSLTHNDAPTWDTHPELAKAIRQLAGTNKVNWKEEGL